MEATSTISLASPPLLLPTPRSSTLISSSLRVSLVSLSPYRITSRVRRRGIIVRAEIEDEGRKGQTKPQVSFAEQLLDYIEAGPKLRKWYGAPDQLPRDGADGAVPSQEAMDRADQQPEEVADAVLISDGDSEIGQLIVLALIVKRRRVRVLVSDAKKATSAFGPYVEPIRGNTTSPFVVDKALNGVKSIVITSEVGTILERAKLKPSIDHIVLLSEVGISAPEPSGLGAIFGGAARNRLRKKEELVRACGLPYSIIRIGQQNDLPGGQVGVALGQGDVLRGRISREDASRVCVSALGKVPKRGLIFEAVNSEGASKDLSASMDVLQEEEFANL